MVTKTKCDNCEDEKTWYIKAGFAMSQEACQKCGQMGTLRMVK